MSKDTPSSTTTTSQTPLGQAQLPFLAPTFGQATSLSQSDPFQYYPGEQLAPIAPQTYQALGLQQARALGGSPVTNSAQGFATSLENGDLLGAGNPYFSNMVGQIGEAIAPSIDSHFNMNGRAGSGANNQAFASALANTAGNLAYQNYGDTLARMVQETAFAPSLANQDYTDISQLGSVGDAVRNLQQGYTNEDISRFYGTQQAPWQTLAQLQTALGQPLSGNGSVSGQVFSNPLGQALGAGIGALGLYNGVQGLLAPSAGSAAATGAALGATGAAAGTGISAADMAMLAAMPVGI